MMRTLLISVLYLACRVPFWIRDLVTGRKPEPLSSDG
jgi:hypothetical protein